MGGPPTRKTFIVCGDWNTAEWGADDACDGVRKTGTGRIRKLHLAGVRRNRHWSSSGAASEGVLDDPAKACADLRYFAGAGWARTRGRRPIWDIDGHRACLRNPDAVNDQPHFFRGSGDGRLVWS